MRLSVALFGVLLAARAVSAAEATPQVAADRQLAERIRALIVQLGDDKYDVREDATSQLKKIGRPALAALEAAAKDPDLERANRATTLADFVRRLPERDPSKVNKNATNGYMAAWGDTKQIQTLKVDADTAIDSIRFRAARTAGITGALTVELREFGDDKAEPLASGEVPFEWTDDKGKEHGVTCYFNWFEVKHEAKLEKGKTYALAFSSKASPDGGRWLINCFYRDTFPGGKHLCDETGKPTALGDYDLAIELRLKDEVKVTTVPEKTDLPKMEGFGVGHDGENLRTPETPPENPGAAN